MELLIGVEKAVGTGQIESVFLKNSMTHSIRRTAIGNFRAEQAEQALIHNLKYIKEFDGVELPMNTAQAMYGSSAMIVRCQYNFSTRTLSGLTALTCEHTVDSGVATAGAGYTPIITDDYERNEGAVQECIQFAKNNGGCIVLNGVILPSMRTLFRYTSNGEFETQGERLSSYEVEQLDYVHVFEASHRVSGFIAFYKGEYFLVPLFVKSDYNESQYIPLSVQGTGKQAVCALAYLEKHAGEAVVSGVCLCKAHAGTTRERLRKQSAFPCLSLEDYENLYSSTELCKESIDSVCFTHCTVTNKINRGKMWLLNGVLDFDTVPDWTEEDLAMFRTTHAKAGNNTKGGKATTKM